MLGRFLPVRTGGGGTERSADDPPAGIGGVDDVVDLEVRRGVDGLPVLVGAGDHLLEQRIALGRVLHRGQLVAIAELHRPLQPHAAELARRPGHGEHRCLGAAAGHRLPAEPVHLAEHDGEERHRQVGADHEQSAAVPHQAGALRFGPHHHPRRVAEEQQRQIEGVAQLHEAGRLVGPVRVDGAAEVRRIVGHDADGATGHASERRDHAGPNPRRSSSAEPVSTMVSMTWRTS